MSRPYSLIEEYVFNQVLLAKYKLYAQKYPGNSEENDIDTALDFLHDQVIPQLEKMMRIERLSTYPPPPIKPDKTPGSPGNSSGQ